MIGLIVTGHGHFGSGLSEALNVIAGPAENYAYVDFELGDSTDDLANRLTAAMDSMSECDSVIILTDLVGGSPFKVAVELGYPRGYQVVAGTNLGMLIEINLVRQFMDDVNALADQAVNVGKDQVQRFVFTAPEATADDDFSDGI